MQLKIKIIGLAVACFFIFLLAMFPARAALMLAGPAGLEAFGVTGSVWNGQARIISIAGQQLRNTEWTLNTSALLTGKLAGDFKARWNGGFVEGTGGISLGGTITLDNVDAGFQLAAIKSMLNVPDLQGQASIRIDRLKVKDNWPVEIVANGQVRELASSLMGRGDAARIGSIAITFDSTTATEENTINGRIEDLGGALKVNGNLLLTRPNNYSLNVRIKAQPDAPQALQKNIEFLGSPEADGFRVFQLAGSI